MTPKEISQARLQMEVDDLTPKEKEQLTVFMEGFKQAACETIQGGEELLRMCDGCAFRKGTEANNTAHTVLIAITCVLKEETFHCHKRFTPTGETKICNGWINVMNNK